MPKITDLRLTDLLLEAVDSTSPNFQTKGGVHGFLGLNIVYRVQFSAAQITALNGDTAGSTISFFPPADQPTWIRYIVVMHNMTWGGDDIDLKVGTESPTFVNLASWTLLTSSRWAGGLDAAFYGGSSTMSDGTIVHGCLYDPSGTLAEPADRIITTAEPITVWLDPQSALVTGATGDFSVYIHCTHLPDLGITL